MVQKYDLEDLSACSNGAVAWHFWQKIASDWRASNEDIAISCVTQLPAITTNTATSLTTTKTTAFGTSQMKVFVIVQKKVGDKMNSLGTREAQRAATNPQGRLSSLQQIKDEGGRKRSTPWGPSRLTGQPLILREVQMIPPENDGRSICSIFVIFIKITLL